MSLARILAQHGIGDAPWVSRGTPSEGVTPVASGATAQRERLRRLAKAAGVPWDAINRRAEVEGLAGYSDDELRGYAHLLHLCALRDMGRVPDGWDVAAVCEGCGAVWLWPGVPAFVIACPWCVQRRAGVPFPRPPVRCGDCRHFAPDPLNPEAGVGACLVPRRARAGEPLHRPAQVRQCDEHRQASPGRI